VNQDGLPLRIVLSAGQPSDKAAVEALIDGLPPAKALLPLVEEAPNFQMAPSGKDRAWTCGISLNHPCTRDQTPHPPG
jgi:hypothetical protein